ncbi:hypothetical protein EON63_12445 [archaeon]|nr:MAG: hypothetical protein EON63_12445 [archaeon]
MSCLPLLSTPEQAATASAAVEYESVSMATDMYTNRAHIHSYTHARINANSHSHISYPYSCTHITHSRPAAIWKAARCCWHPMAMHTQTACSGCSGRRGSMLGCCRRWMKTSVLPWVRARIYIYSHLYTLSYTTHRTLHHTHHTLRRTHLTPYTLHHIYHTIHHTPYPIHHISYTIHRAGSWSRDQFYQWVADYLRYLWYQEDDTSLPRLVLGSLGALLQFDAEVQYGGV